MYSLLMGRGGCLSTNTLVQPRSKPEVSANAQVADLWGDPHPARAYSFDKYLVKNNPELTRQEIFQQVKDQQAYSPDYWGKALNDFCAKGFKVVVPEYMPDTDKKCMRQEEGLAFFSGFAYIYKDGKAVGDFNFSVAPDVNHQPEFRIGMIGMKSALGFTRKGEQPDYSGNGFGKELLNHLEKKCLQTGISKITLRAVNKGCYVWAKLGFEIDPREEHGYGKIKPADFASYNQFTTAVISTIKNQLADNCFSSSHNHLISEEQRKEIVDLLQRAEINSLSDLIKLSQQKSDFNFAKEYMPGIEYNGIKVLTS